LTDPYQDKFFIDSAIKIISKYYNREAARAGQGIDPDLQLSPRIGFTYKIPRENIIIRGGGGIFTGQILNIWSSLLHRNNGVSIGSININPQQYGLKFNPDPYNQPTPRELGINLANAKGELNLISKNFKYPAVFRTSFSVAKNLKSNWTISVEGILTKNINETRYTNINILPPTKTSSLPDARNVYSLNSSPDKISSPYTQIFLLSNNHEQKGSSYSLSVVIDKQISSNFSFNAGYTFGKSKVFFETSGGNSAYSTQWMQTETVNGKNFATLSASNLNPGHRVFAGAVKKFSYTKNKLATTVSIFYNGQSGSPYSYVNIGSIVNDNGNNENYDLIYIPTVAELNEMIFIPNTVGAMTYSAQQQKDRFNDFIEHDKYLQKHRGEFAERNGAGLPFTNIIDLRIQQDFKIKIKKKETGFSIIYDVFNFTNMLNKNWGRIYFMNDDKFPLIQFAGYANTTTLTPQYRFTPLKGTPYSIQSSTLPGNSARWISQLGFRINFG
ncbi:MAG TPA: hypothetical protein VNA26_01770, partial [Chitinophagaceae bacterium]|nr:hypothetical protein [Chitinophagaceae bacterium]